MEVKMGDDIRERLCGCGASMSRNDDGDWECDNYDGCDAGADLADRFVEDDDEA